MCAALCPQTECVTPQKKEAEDEKSAKPKKKRKVSSGATCCRKEEQHQPDFVIHMTVFCSPEEEDHHRRPVLVGAQARLSGGPAEPARSVLLGQTLCDRAGGAPAAG